MTPGSLERRATLGWTSQARRSATPRRGKVGSKVVVSGRSVAALALPSCPYSPKYVEERFSEAGGWGSEDAQRQEDGECDAQQPDSDDDHRCDSTHGLLALRHLAGFLLALLHDLSRDQFRCYEDSDRDDHHLV